MTFDDLEFRPHGLHKGGEHAELMLGNRYGVSVIRTPFRYGGREGLYELAVLRKDAKGRLRIIGGDVYGYLKPDGVTNFIRQVELWENIG